MSSHRAEPHVMNLEFVMLEIQFFEGLFCFFFFYFTCEFWNGYLQNLVVQDQKHFGVK